MKPRYTAEPSAAGWVVRDHDASPGTQILAILQDRHAAEQAAQALNRGLCEAIDSKGRWEDAL